MVGDEALKVGTILFPQDSEYPLDVSFIVLELLRGVEVFNSESDAEVVLVQIRFLVFFNIYLVVLNVWVVLRNHMFTPDD